MRYDEEFYIMKKLVISATVTPLFEGGSPDKAGAKKKSLNATSPMASMVFSFSAVWANGAVSAKASIATETISTPSVAIALMMFSSPTNRTDR